MVISAQKNSQGSPPERANVKLERIRAQAEQRAAAEESAQIVQLAFWPDTHRALPTDFLACALFAGIHAKNTPTLRGEELACINGYSVTFTGKVLTQVHADVVMGALQLMRGLPEGSPVIVRPRSFLRSIGRHTGGSDRKSFRQLVDDIIATAVRITTPDGKLSYSGSILTRSKDATDGVNTAFALEVNRDLAKLFLNGFGTVDWAQRRALLKKPLALWLQLFLSRFPKPVKVSELRRLSRSSAPLRSFRRQLRIALGELEKAGVGRWCVDDQDVMRAREQLPACASPKVPDAITSGAHPCRVTDAAKRRFGALYPEHDVELCLRDWTAWSGSRLAKNPDAAFLGFARKWVMSTR
jgi:hypothetical protein